MSKRGRPAGSRNADYAPAVEIPATCPKCGSAELKAIRGNKVSELAHCGQINGVAYARIEWHDKVAAAGNGSG